MSLLAHLHSVGASVKFVVGVNPRWAITSIALTLVHALLPALSVVAINYVSFAAQAYDSLLIPLIILVALFGLGIFLTDLYRYVDDILNKQTHLATGRAYTNTLAQLQPQRYADAEFMGLVRSARSALEEKSFHASFVASKCLLAAVISSVSLALALWHLHHAVALVAFLAPIPLFVNYVTRTYIVKQTWGALVTERRRGEYFLDQVTRQQSGFEAASLGGTALLVRKSNEGLRNFERQLLLREKATFMVELATGVATLAVYATCVLLLAGNLQLAVVVAALSGLTSYINSLKYLNHYLRIIAEYLTPNNDLLRFLATRGDQRTQLSLPSGKLVVFEDVHVSYGTHQAVRGVTLELSPDGFTALVGLNGCGKTSLIKAIMGSQVSATGQVRCDQQTFDLAANDTVFNFASVQQDYGRYELVVRDLLALGLDYVPSDEQLWHALAQVELDTIVRELPQGLDTLLGEQWEGGVNVSGGQWQRLAIARAFLSRAPLLYLDEPTAAVDARCEEVIFTHLEEVAQQRLVLVTTHRVSTLKNAACIYVMRDGQIVEQGTFAALNQPGSYFRELFASQLVA